ncbi:MAG: HD domain-containing protein [Pseudomonadota bacterium]
MIQFHVIKDPVHGAMQFTTLEDGWIKPFLDSGNVQRLRHIRQLGLADWIFPGAVHTRFSHSVGCCYVGSQICNKLGVSTRNKQLVMLACLLHDIGHGPFSHAFETLFYQGGIRHERWTPMFIADYANEEFLSSFNKKNSDYPLSQEDLKTIQDLIGHQSESTLLSDIVSSQLDADRLDYLHRDSHFCGVTYGEYDFRWLLHCLTVIDQKGVARLGVTTKGIGVVEQYLMARRLMVRNVYHHGKKHGGEFFLQSFLHYLAQAVNEDGHFTELAANPLIIFLQSVNRYNTQAKQTADLHALKTAFLKQNYALYKQLCDYDIYTVIRYLAHQNFNHTSVTLAKRLYARQLPKVIYIDEKSVNSVSQQIEEIKKQHDIEDWQITLLQLPHLSYEMEQDPILIQDSFGRVSFLHDDSFMVEALSDRRENSSLVCIDTNILHHFAVKKLIGD